MLRPVWLFGGIVLILGMGQVAWAQHRLEYPRPCPNECVPNVGGYGYFPTIWRQWPGEDRQSQINPRSVGAEVLPTPQGQERLPLPRGVAPPQPPLAAPDEGILPPEQPPSSGFGIELPGEPGNVLPPVEGGLPGLPVEPNQIPVPGPFESGQTPKPTPEVKPSVTPDAEKAAKPAEDVENKKDQEEPPKEESKPDEQPEPSSDDKPSSDTGRGNVDSTAVGATEPPVDNLAADWQRGTVVSLVGGDQSDRRSAAGAFCADSIGAAAPDCPTCQVEPAAYATAESPAQREVGDDHPTLPSVALNGYCPVELTLNGRWALGDLRWTVVHDGHIFRLSGPEQRRRFLANPEAFAPAYSGNDAVLAVDQQRKVLGRAAFCAMYQGRLYMFFSPATQSQFNRDPRRYAAGK